MPYKMPITAMWCAVWNTIHACLQNVPTHFFLLAMQHDTAIALSITVLPHWKHSHDHDDGGGGGTFSESIAHYGMLYNMKDQFNYWYTEVIN
jgi:hypothetical protein